MIIPEGLACKYTPRMLFFIEAQVDDLTRHRQQVTLYHKGTAIDKLRQHLQLTVGLEAWQHATGMEIVEKFAAKLEIQFIAEFRDAVLDVF